MTQGTIEPPELGRPPTAEIRRRRVSLIWALPVVAVIVAGWLGYTTFASKGPTITITFRTATGLEAGKTLIKHNDIQLGVVQSVEPSPDLSSVTATAQMNLEAADTLHAGTKFWVVRPRLSVTSLSGLETLVSGIYIEMDPGPGEAARKFTALENPPVVRAGVKGTEYLLTTNRLGSIGAGSPIFYRGLNVGEAASYTFNAAEKDVTIRAFVRAPYDALIHAGTQFWDDSGISLSTGGNGFKIKVDSLEAVLAGGIAFETPEAEDQGEQSKAGSSFTLYSDRDEAQESTFTTRAHVVAEFDGSVRGLEVGAPVDLHGITIGRVVDVHLTVDAATHSVKVPVTLAVDFGRLGMTNYNRQTFGSGALARQLVANGWRAQLRTSSLLTGQLYVAFDYFPNAPAAKVEEADGVMHIPTVPSSTESIMQSAQQLLDKLAAMPIDKIMTQVDTILGSVDKIVNAPEIGQSLRALNESLASVQRLTANTQVQLGPLLQSVRNVSDAADATVKRGDTTLATITAAYGADSEVRSDMVQLLRELEGTARSVRGLATYLEQHPESLVRGKGGTQ